MNRRVASIDALRGMVMIIMALDHTRDYFHSAAMIFQPEDLTRTNAILFFTRWITHLCAPVFMFSAGLGAFFWLSRDGRTKRELTRFLWTRGLWLVVLDVTVVRFAMLFGMREGILILSVLWALGWSMVLLGLLVHLPLPALTALSIAGIALHNLADPIQAAQFGAFAPIWNILHQLGVFPVAGVPVLTAYPLIPWVFVMSAGFCFGHLFQLPSRRQWLLRFGLALSVGFLIVRGINAYGDPQPWSNTIPGTAVMSFLRTNKYPPSLAYLLMTLGPAMLLLWWLDRLNLKPANSLMVFGRVPLFYFIGHLFAIHSLTIPLALARYGHAGFLLHPLPSMGGDAKLYPPGYGYDLWVVYVVWLVVVALMYPLCLWFARLKQRRNDWWLSYL